MEKRVEAQEAKQPLSEHLHNFWTKQQEKSILKSLKPFHPEEKAILLTKGDAVAVLSEASQRDLEQLGRMSLILDTEVPSRGVGSVAKGRKISFVDKIVLPDKDKIFTIAYDLELAVFDKKHILEQFGIDSKHTTLLQFVSKTIHSGSSVNIDILNSLDGVRDCLVDPNFNFKDFLNKKWEVVSSHSSMVETKYFDEKLKNTGTEVLDAHAHHWTVMSHNWDKLSILDINRAVNVKKGAGPPVEWFVVIGIEQGTPTEKFRLDRSMLAAYYSKLNPLIGKHDFDRSLLDKAKDKDIEAMKSSHALVSHFAESHRAKLMTYEELVEKVG
jgi:hypothetical protein